MRLILLVLHVCLAGTAWADAGAPRLVVDAIGEKDVPLTGAQCDFSIGTKTVLRSDWTSKVWIKVGGKIEEFNLVGDPKEAVGKDRWHGTFKSQWGSVMIDLRTIAAGEADTVAMEGTVNVKKGQKILKMKVSGGCGA